MVFTITMNFPVTIPIANTEFLLHGIFEFLAFFLAFRYFLFLRRKSNDSISTPKRLWIIIGAIFGSVLGSRLIGGLEDWHQLQIADNKWLYFYQNKTVLGGFLGGLAGVEIIKKIIGEKKSSGDLFTYPMIAGLILGRIGCFSMGIYEETYGIETHSIFGLNLGDGKLRHPVTLYEMVFLAFLWIGIYLLEKKYQLVEGGKFKIFMICYLIFRFLLDFIKPSYCWSIGFSTIQLTAFAGLLYYYKYVLRPSILIKR
jgi:phosphatidylglycerol---prolipoprotein diacylglyceryl transferase